MRLKDWMSGLAGRVSAAARRLRSDVRGNVAMMMALAMPVVVMASFGGLDIHRATTVRMNLQDALDAAALAAARSPYSTSEDIQRIGMNALRSNLQAYPDVALLTEQTQFELVEERVVVARAKVNVKAIVANIVLPPYGKLLDDYMLVGASTEVDRATRDLEVALVLDITGSMAGTRLTDLKTAANDLVDLVIPDQPQVNRTRIALVPYSMGVNAGAYAVQARGAIRGPTQISDAKWRTIQKDITGITRANSATLSSSNHGLQVDDFVYIDSISTSSNMAGVFNGRIFKVSSVNTNSFNLQRWNGWSWVNINTSSADSYSSGGKVYKCMVSTCEIVVTSPGHKLSSGEQIRLSNLSGMTGLNGDTRTVSQILDADRFIPTNAFGPSINQNYSTSSSDAVQCLELGCEFYRFPNYYGNRIVKQVSTCVSERQGGNAHSDRAPGGAPVGLAYPSSDNPCLGNVITPLTDDKKLLHDTIGSGSTGYKAVGSTAGQIGVEWGWYMLSPTFGSMFPEDSRPEAANTAQRLKVMVLMTDGEFNTPYCDGVVAGAISGSGDLNQHIRCPTEVNNPFDFSVKTCNAMKSQGYLIYTVGLAINDSAGGPGIDTAKEVMQGCASGPGFVYFPNNGTSLKSAFVAIGRDISQLRISK